MVTSAREISLTDSLGRRTGPRRQYTIEEKVQIVKETHVKGASVATVARRHDVNPNQVFAWRRLYRQGLLENTNGKAAGLLPVHVVETSAVDQIAGSRSAQRRPLGLIQVELPKGHLRINGRVDSEALRVVLEELLG